MSTAPVTPQPTIEDRLAAAESRLDAAEKRIAALMSATASQETRLSNDVTFNNAATDEIVKIKNKLAAHGMEVV